MLTCLGPRTLHPCVGLAKENPCHGIQPRLSHERSTVCKADEASKAECQAEDLLTITSGTGTQKAPFSSFPNRQWWADTLYSLFDAR